MVCFLGDISLPGIIVRLVLSVQMPGCLKGYPQCTPGHPKKSDQTAERRQSKYRCQQCEGRGRREQDKSKRGHGTKGRGRKALSSSRSRNHGVSVSSAWSTHGRERKDAAEDV